MKYIYVSNKTKDIKDIKEKTNVHIIHTYKSIKKKKNSWGIFLINSEKIIGCTQVAYTEESKKPILHILWVFVEEEYRGKKICYELLKRTLIKHEKNKGKPNLIKIVNAQGMGMLKCSLRVFKELNYKIKIYKNQYDQIMNNKDFDIEEDINKLKSISYEKAIDIEEKNKEYDIWYSLFFSK
tara:strand:- start:1684 stop:2229 length:546 start_codon:yes stop_codon:yes gene_type:complete